MNGQSTKEKGNVGKKLHRQFSHPACTKFKGLLTDANIIDKELYEIIDRLDENCEICQKFKKPKPIVGFPLAKRFSHTVVFGLKEWPSSPKIWLLHLVDHFTRFSASFIINEKKKLSKKSLKYGYLLLVVLINFYWIMVVSLIMSILYLFLKI